MSLSASFKIISTLPPLIAFRLDKAVCLLRSYFASSLLAVFANVFDTLSEVESVSLELSLQENKSAADIASSNDFFY
jgi:hypothetical protein